MIGRGRAAVVVVGGVLMCVGSLLPFGFSDGGDFGLHDTGAVYGFRYGGPILGRLSDWVGASRWVGDAWIRTPSGTARRVTPVAAEGGIAAAPLRRRVR